MRVRYCGNRTLVSCLDEFFDKEARTAGSAEEQTSTAATLCVANWSDSTGCKFASKVRDTFLYAASVSPAPNARCNSRRVAPVAKNARMIRSSDTEGSPASILATHDWLEPIFRARSILAGRTVIPGLIDSHLHAMRAA